MQFALPGIESLCLKKFLRWDACRAEFVSANIWSDEFIINIASLKPKNMESSNKSSTSIKNWAADDRPREKLLSKGSESLSDSDVLAILINTGHKNKSAFDLATDILALGQKTISSTERRVGTEGGKQWSPERKKKK